VRNLASARHNVEDRTRPGTHMMTWCRHPQADSSSLVNLMRGLPFLADDRPVGPPGRMKMSAAADR
jgi:hypothetical protein